ncbi:hypothetical protein [Thalassospira sp.]|uniref:hypothetical protein n=1 Tax=Thalassospira sp. TaxID=1912094 RepID=UPI0027372744|nr:hypothetical protein [Thalassospira sp.]MDP2697583.1 hypothetical protein [Thalassospira sp.]
MGAFASLAPMAISAVQTGREISARRSSAQAASAQTEADRAAQIAALQSEQQQRARQRAEQARIAEATQRARQGGAGLQAGGAGSAAAVLAGLRRRVLDGDAEDAQTAALQAERLNRNAAYQQQSLLSSSRNETLARLTSWFASRNGFGG